MNTPLSTVVGRFIRRNGYFNVSERIGSFRINRTVIDTELGLVDGYELEADYILACSIECVGIAGHERFDGLEVALLIKTVAYVLHVTNIIADEHLDVLFAFEGTRHVAPHLQQLLSDIGT